MKKENKSINVKKRKQKPLELPKLKYDKK